MTQTYTEKIKFAQSLVHPRVLINVCSHGTETIGLGVKSLLNNVDIIKGSFVCHIANPEAVAQGVRFIKSDLNRSFPGNPDGTHEEKIAYNMMEYITNFDYIIDVHSTVSGMRDCLIIEDDSPLIQKMISASSHCKTVLHMNATRGSSIFTATRQSKNIIPAVAFEYGDNSSETVQRTYDDIVRMFSALGMILELPPFNHTRYPSQFDCYEKLSKLPSDEVFVGVKNYELVKKGDRIGTTAEGLFILAQEDFYPVLFGEKTYTTIFGFMAKKL